VRACVLALLVLAAAPAAAEDSARGLQVLLDPKGEAWAPRRGHRTELGVSVGGEAALAEVGALERLPTLGGVALTLSGRYYPVDRLAITTGLRSYLGFDAPAAGTTAATVVAPFAGVRWDLVRENRFSLLADFASGPAFFVFGAPAGGATSAVGMEANMALSARYSIGGATFELRPVLGGRIGDAGSIGRPRFDVGPFSALYFGLEGGFTWSFRVETEPG
jgi:hypothetical protein